MERMEEEKEVKKKDRDKTREYTNLPKQKQRKTIKF